MPAFTINISGLQPPSWTNQNRIEWQNRVRSDLLKVIPSHFLNYSGPIELIAHFRLPPEAYKNANVVPNGSDLDNMIGAVFEALWTTRTKEPGEPKEPEEPRIIVDDSWIERALISKMRVDNMTEAGLDLTVRF